jgi:DinB superfamily
MSTSQNAVLREQLVAAMRGDQSHLDFDAALKGFPVGLAGKKPKGAPHTAWQLLEHMRIAQHDILEFSRNPKHVSPKWPDEYWVKAGAPADEKAWKTSVATFRKEAKAMDSLIQDLSRNLFKAIEGGQGQTLLREALVLAAHNSYHLGQIVYLKKMLTS